MNGAVNRDEMHGCPTEGAIGLLALLIRSGRLAESRLDDALASAGLTFVKWRTVDGLLKAEEPVSLGALAELVGCVRSNVTQLIDKLETEGVVRRIPDPQDRRSILVEVTDKGREMHRAGRQALESATQALFDPMDQEDREELRRLLLTLQSE